MLDRRRFLKLLGLGSLGLGASSILSSCNFNSKPIPVKPLADLGFEPIMASLRDEVVLPRGFNYRIVRSWQDSIGPGLKFGFNNDFTCFFPLEQSDEALLWVNHESVDPKYIPDIDEQRRSVGGSVIKIKRNADQEWIYDYSDERNYNRRLDANSPVEFTGPLRDYFQEPVFGTLANCSGGRTPWGTVLTCEENYEHFDSKYKWRNFKRKHYGWVVEVDPYNPKFTPRKHSLLGRFAHENAAIAISQTGKVVIYMGDDKENEHIYKFVSARSFTKPHSKIKLYEYSDIVDGFSNLLTEGQLYVARFYDVKTGKTISPSLDPSETGVGEWLPISRADKRIARRYRSDAEMLINTRQAAKLVDASPLDRPEDLEVSPHDASIYVSLTKNLNRMNNLGSIIRIFEDAADHEALKFSYNNFVVGSVDSGFCCPDNLAFDGLGNLWVTTDAAPEFMLPNQRKLYGNNGLYVIALSGEQAGIPRRFASAPLGAELTGPCFSEDAGTLFLSVQHPSEGSLWPRARAHNYPRPSVISIKLNIK